MDNELTFAAIRKAAERIRGQIVRTPCIHSKTLSELVGAQIWLKFETQQFTASFKERGALHKLLCLRPDEQARGVVTLSAGNHAQGLAYHARRLGIRAVIVMPRHTPSVKVENTRVLGAEVILRGETVEDCRAIVDDLITRRNLVLVHPFDDPMVMAGQGTLALEMLEQAPEIDTLVASVGGGGLLAGLSVAAHGIRPEIRLFGVQTEAYPATFAAWNHGNPIFSSSTVAEGIAVKEPSAAALAIFRKEVEDVLVVSEEEIEDSVLMLLEIEKAVVEGAGAVGLALVRKYPERFRNHKVGLILCGGNIDLPVLSAIIQRGMVRGGRMARLHLALRDVPGMLAAVSSCIAATGANILEVHHQRSFTRLTVTQAELEVVLLTRGADHVQEILDRLRAEGHTVEWRDA
ncbi:MAG: threonine ammonia-lyase [Kiritimatiellia bacterium]|nr:threonine ammonia-lyase [Kiritimatiellia bacterium]